MLKKKKRVVFSAVSGRVLDGGKPVAGLEVVQRWSWLMVDDGSARTTTDARGRFRFAEVSVLRARAPKDVMVTQDLEVVHGGRRVTLWNLTRRDLEPGSELGGEPLELTAELSAPQRELKLPVGRDQLAIISGLATFAHPFLARWATVRAQVSEADVAQALARFLDSPAGREGLAAFVPAIGRQRARVAALTRVSGVELTDGFLYTDAVGGALAVREAPRFIGFTTRARVQLTLDSGQQLEGGFFAWTLYLALDAAGRPHGEARFSDRWEVDLRPWVRQQVEAALERPKLAQAVREALRATPGQQPLEVLSRGRKQKTLDVEQVEVVDAAVTGSKDDWATVRVTGTLALRGRAVRPRFVGHLSVALASLDAPAWALAPAGGAPHFTVIPFKVSLGTVKKTCARGQPIVMWFEVENTLDTPQRFLKWHSPFEGFLNDFLEVRPAGGGDEVPYAGPMVSRGPPDDDDYLALAAGEKARVEVDLTPAYPVRAAGEYVLRFKPLGEAWADAARFWVK